MGSFVMITREQMLAYLRKGVGNSTTDLRDGKRSSIVGMVYNRRQLAVQRIG